MPTMTAERVYEETDAFLDRVLLDGRYVGEIRERPREIARVLEVDLSEEAEERLVSMDTPSLLEHLYDQKFNPGTTPHHPYIMGEIREPRTITIAVGIIVVVGGIVVVAGVAIVIFSEKDPDAIVDRSPYRERKL